MPRYTLRTLLIVLALGPPALAWAWVWWPAFGAGLLTVTVRDALWLTLIAAILIGFQIQQRRSQRRIEALATRIQRIRE
jgi:hypothetical protein